jgi:hypothetical protein
MADPKLIDDLARRAGVSKADAEAVLEALGALAPERVSELLRRSSRGPAPAPAPARYVFDALDVEALIDAARKHPLGLEFLLNGDLSAVAATFQAHAFTVDAAREHLRGQAR